MVGAMWILVMRIEELYTIKNSAIASMMDKQEGFVRRQINVFALISVLETEYVGVDFAR
jgi:predicted transcriptional regulator